MKAKQFLLQIKHYDQIIEEKLEQVKNWQEAAVDVSVNYDGIKVQPSGNRDKIGNAVAKYVDIEDEIADTIYNSLLAREKIIEIIEQLSLEQYDLLYKMYVKGMEIPEIKSTYKRVSIKRLNRIHDEALESVQNILDKGDDLD